VFGSRRSTSLDDLFHHAVPFTALWAASHFTGADAPALLANILCVCF
jgi:hypothetical protein